MSNGSTELWGQEYTPGTQEVSPERAHPWSATETKWLLSEAKAHIKRAKAEGVVLTWNALTEAISLVWPTDFTRRKLNGVRQRLQKHRNQLKFGGRPRRSPAQMAIDGKLKPPRGVRRTTAPVTAQRPSRAKTPRSVSSGDITIELSGSHAKMLAALVSSGLEEARTYTTSKGEPLQRMAMESIISVGDNFVNLVSPEEA